MMLVLIGAPVGSQHVIGMIPGPHYFLGNLSLLGPALRGIYLLVLLGEGRRATCGVEGHDALSGLIKMGRLCGIGDFHRRTLDAVIKDLMDDFTPPFAVLRVALPRTGKDAGRIGGVAGNAERIDRLVRLPHSQTDGHA